MERVPGDAAAAADHHAKPRIAALQLVQGDEVIRLVGLIDRSGSTHHGWDSKTTAEQAAFAAKRNLDAFALTSAEKLN